MSIGQAIAMILDSIPNAGPGLGANKCICGDCRGKRFNPKHLGGRRKCQRCRGKGYTDVGRTKR